MTDFADLLPVAHQAVDLASNTMRTMQPGALTAKGDRDMTSEVDYSIEAQVRAFLPDRTPHIGFLGEENGITENRSALGVIDLPFLGSRYSAAEGNGANANGEPINASTT